MRDISDMDNVRQMLAPKVGSRGIPIAGEANVVKLQASSIWKKDGEREWSSPLTKRAMHPPSEYPIMLNLVTFGCDSTGPAGKARIESGRTSPLSRLSMYESISATARAAEISMPSQVESFSLLVVHKTARSHAVSEWAA